MRFLPQKRSYKQLFLVAVLLAAAGTAYISAHVFATGSQTYYVATTGSDGNACTQTAPCLSFNRAYDVASAGDTVQIAAGVYDTPWLDAASQTIHGELISWDGTKASATSNVVFKPATGASVTVNGNIRVMSSHVTFENISLVDPNNSNNKGDVQAFNYDPFGIPASPLHDVGSITFQDITARNFNIDATHDVSIVGGSYGPSSACGSAQPGLTQYGGGNNALRPQPGAPDPYNVTVDGVTVHNIMSYDLVNCHTEGLAIFSGSNVIVRNSKFYGNDVYDILAQANSGSGALGRITMENNWFAQSTNSGGSGSGSDAVELDNIAQDVTIANNSFNYSLLFQDPSVSLSNVSIVGNILQGPVYFMTGDSSIGSMCGKSGVTAQYNITAAASGQHCTTSTNTEIGSVSSLYTNPANDATMDYNLKTGSQAIDFVPTSATPVTNDIDYRCRPVGAADDAGASEYGATNSCPVGMSCVPSGGQLLCSVPNGTTIDSSVDVSANEILTVDGSVCDTTVQSSGTLKGNGTVCNLTVNSGGIVAPGHSPGTLTVNGNLTETGTYQAEIQSPGTTAGTDYDQIIVTGNVDLTGGSLDASLLNSFTPSVGQKYTIINNQGANAVTSTFNGLAEGAVFAVGSTKLQITYKGGDGNDVVLTVVSPDTPVTAAPGAGTTTPGVPNTGLAGFMSNPLGAILTTMTATCTLVLIAHRFKQSSEA